MKIMAISDLHNRLQSLERELGKDGLEMVIVAGDLSDKGMIKPWKSAETWRKFVRICNANPAIEFVLVCGNHDTSLWPKALWDRFRHRLPKNLHLLGGYFSTGALVVKGVRLAGGKRYFFSAPEADIYVYHKNPFKAKWYELRPTMKVKGDKPLTVLYGHEHCWAQGFNVDGNLRTMNVSCCAHNFDYPSCLII